MESARVGTTIRWWHVALLLVGALLVRLVFMVGLTGSDDLHYARQAQQMSQGAGPGTP